MLFSVECRVLARVYDFPFWSRFNTLTDLGLIGARLGHAVLWLSRLMPENLQIDCIREKEARWRNNQAAAPQSLKVRDRGRPQHQRALPCTPQGSPSCTGPRHARWGARALPALRCPTSPTRRPSTTPGAAPTRAGPRAAEGHRKGGLRHWVLRSRVRCAAAHASPRPRSSVCSPLQPSTRRVRGIKTRGIPTQA